MEEIQKNYTAKITPVMTAVKLDAALRSEELDEQRKQLRNSLNKTDKGGVAGTYENYEAVLRYDPLLKGAIRLNELTGRNDIVREMWWQRTSPAFDDLDMNYIILYIERYYGLGSDKKLERALKVVASDYRFHPIREVLDHLAWDGTPRIRGCLRHFLGATEDDYTEAMLLHFLLGAILRVFNPGCKYEEILCLVGGQGIGKSTFFRFLAIRDDWFSDDIRRLDDDKVFQRLQGHWIIEMSEMLATNNAKSVEESRSFFSRQKDTYRTPYESQPKDRPRQCVFGGTSNSMDFLPLDRAGNRRFLPVVTEAVEPEIHILENEAESRAYIMQVWAEAMEIYRSGKFSMKFGKEIRDQLLNVQRDCMPEDEKAGKIIEYLARFSGDKVCTRQLFEEALNRFDEPKRWELREIGEIMRNSLKDEWKAFSNPRNFGIRYGRQKGWERIVQDAKEPDISEPLRLPESAIHVQQMEMTCYNNDEALAIGLPVEWVSQEASRQRTADNEVQALAS